MQTPRSIPMIHRAAIFATAAVLAGCSGPGSSEARSTLAPHGGHSARWYFERGDFTWQTTEAPGIHLHYAPGSYAAAHAPQLARAAVAALRHDLALGGLRALDQPVELFLVDSVREAVRLTGMELEGQAIPGELTAVMVARPGWWPHFRHEIMHALTTTQWRGNRVPDWLSEGVAMWATGTCQGHTMDAIAAGYLRDGALPPLREFKWGFDQDEIVHAYATSASLVEFVVRSRGLGAVRTMWKAEASVTEHPLGPGGEGMEAEWRRHLAAIPPARVDTALAHRHGCESP